MTLLGNVHIIKAINILKCLKDSVYKNKCKHELEVYLPLSMGAYMVDYSKCEHVCIQDIKVNVSMCAYMVEYGKCEHVFTW